MDNNETPGTLAIMAIYLVLFTIAFALVFVNLGTKWPIS